jgi:glycosyltransferase involved in cell wall biosynthesis
MTSAKGLPLAGEHHIPHKHRGQAKVALVHDFLLQMGGAEKVLEVLHGMFPTAPVYTSAYDPEAMPAHYQSWDIRTSFLQRMPMKSKLHRVALPLYPLAFESFDLSGYDLVLSSSSAFARGIITQPDTIHICYTHTPMRYAWSTQTYMENERVGSLSRALATPVLHYLRLWDAAAAQRPDYYVANSSVVAARIRKFYRRESVIIHPPVDTARFALTDGADDYYIVVSRFVPYKRLDLAIDAFTKLGRPLKVVGTGRQREALQARAGKNIEFLGHVSDADLPRLVAHARAFIMPGEEDFGIAPVEAMACGVPVIAYAAGGALDTQCDGKTGVLFREPSVDSLCEAVKRFETLQFDPLTIRAHSRCFDQHAYVKNMYDLIDQVTADTMPALAVTTRLQEQVV